MVHHEETEVNLIVKSFACWFAGIGRLLCFRLLILFSFILVSISPVYTQQAQSSDELIAWLWLERASRILAAESPGISDLEDAAAAISIAEEFQAPGRDALYLEALLLLRGYPSESPIRRAYELLGRSLDDRNPPSAAGDLIDFEVRARLWATQALRLKDYRELLKRYRRWPAGHQDDPALLYAAGRAAIYLGFYEEAAVYAKRGEALTEDARVLESLELPFSLSALPAFRALAVAAKDDWALNTLDSAWERWKEELTNALVPWLLSGHIEVIDSKVLASRLPEDLLNALDSSRNPHATPMSVAQIPSFLKSDLSYLRRVSQTGGENELSGYTGTLTADSNYDGYDEEVLRLVGGRPEFRRIDANQDGLYEWEIAYEGGYPLYIRLDEGEMTLTYESGLYPRLLAVSRVAENLRMDLSFYPGGFQWAASENGGYLKPLRYPQWRESELWSGVRMANVTLEDPEKGIITEARTFLAEGYPLKAIERQYPEGAGERPFWLREIIYAEGLPIAGRISFRADVEFPQRRIWELYERYENGSVVGVAWDPQLKGTPAYLKDWALGKYLETQVWDIDADRWMDIRRFQFADGTINVEEIQFGQAEIEDLMAWTTSDWAPWEY